MLPAHGLYGHIRNNTVKSVLLLASFAGLVAAYWYAACLIYSAVVAYASPAFAPDSTALAYDGIAQAARMRALATWHWPAAAVTVWLVAASLWYKAIIRAGTGAHAIERRHAPALYNTVERLAIAAGLPMPRVEIIDSGSLNAYAAGLGPRDATVAVTRGLLAALDPAELEAVVAHEISHIKNRDVRLMVVALVFAGAITLLGDLLGALRHGRSSDGGWRAGDFDGGWDSGSAAHPSAAHGGLAAAPALLAALAAGLVGIATLAAAHFSAILTRLALSRAREYMADAGAVELTGNPDALISALSKIARHDAVPLPCESLRAMMISASFDTEDPMEALLSTHPPIVARIESLVRYAGGRRPSERSARGRIAAEPAPARIPSGAAAVRRVVGARLPAFGRRRA